MKTLFIPIFLLVVLLSSAYAQMGKPNVTNTKKVSFIYVRPSKGLSESSFGHAALRLSPNETPGILDIVVEFVAEIPPNEPGVKKYTKGVGLGGRYPILTAISSFYDFKKLKTISEDRPLEVFELDLDEDEIQKIIKFISDYQNEITQEKYTFFRKNCSYFAALAVERAIGKRLKGKPFPWVRPKQLRKLGIVSSEYKYPAASTERRRYANKYLKEGVRALFPDGSWGVNFASALKDMSFAKRQTSYLKLLWVLRQPDTSVQDRKKIQALVRYLLSQEDDTSTYVLRSMFKDVDKKRVLVSTLNLLEKKFSVGKLKRMKRELIMDEGRFTLKFNWRDKNNRRRSWAKFPFSQLPYDKELGTISFSKKKVARYVQVDKKNWLLSQRLDYSIDYVSKPETLHVFVYVDVSDNVKDFKKDYASHKELSHLAINNSKDFAGEAGNCYAMALLQKAFMERAFFLPDAPINPELNKIQIMKALLDGHFAVIPGYGNIMEFTSSVDKEVLKKFVRSRQAKLIKGTVAQVIENLAKREIINAKNIKTLKMLSDEGIIVPMVIGFIKKGTMTPASKYAHVVLVMDVEDIGEGKHRLTIYDPNTNINSLMVFDEKFKLHYPFFDKKMDYIGILDSISKFDVNLDHAVRSREINTGLLMRTNGLIIPPWEVIRILK